jgi:hypothetical protein
VYATTGTYDEIAEKVKKRYDGYLDRVSFYFPFTAGDKERWRKLIRAFNG